MQDRPAAETEIGQAFVQAITQLDFQRLESLLSPDVRFRALIPRRVSEGSTAAEAVREMHRWFEDTDRMVVMDTTVDMVVDRLHVAWRLRERENGAWYELEQHAFARIADGQLADIALVCSGFRPLGDPIDGGIAGGDDPEQSGPVPEIDLRLDAVGDSCATLTPRIRSAIRTLESGQVLEVVADDPAAPEGLASWSRLTGNVLLGARSGQGAATRFFIRRS